MLKVAQNTFLIRKSHGSFYRKKHIIITEILNLFYTLVSKELDYYCNNIVRKGSDQKGRKDQMG